MNQRTLRQPEGGLAEGSIEEQIIQMASLSYERLPLLELIFERYALALGSAFKVFVAMPCEVTLLSFEYLPCGPALEAIGSPALTAVARADPWDGRIAVSVSPELLFSTLEIMLGGRNGDSRAWSPRSFTAIERRFCQKLAEMVLDELEPGFEPVGGVRFRFDHLENIPSNAVIAPPATPAVRIGCRSGSKGVAARSTSSFPTTRWTTSGPCCRKAFRAERSAATAAGARRSAGRSRAPRRG